ncbi:MAG: hypothetical protein NPIRA05_20040 [Nitrospirales bacterium]|nr:MAG: hypothetical protein NPIRA05_20040 [Nitrospirales bacterium]
MGFGFKRMSGYTEDAQVKGNDERRYRERRGRKTGARFHDLILPECKGGGELAVLVIKSCLCVSVQGDLV